MRPLFLFFFFFYSALSAAANESDPDKNATKVAVLSKIYSQPEPDWGIAIGFRTAEIAFPTDENNVSDFVPKIYYEGGFLYLRGNYGGLRLYQQEQYNLSLLGRRRYFDIPAKYQNTFQGTTIDFGLQFEYLFAPNFPFQVELMSDSDGRQYANTKLIYRIDYKYFDIDLSSRLRFKSSKFNNIYYGLNQVDIGGDMDLQVGTQVRYHVYSNLYLLGEANLTRLGRKTYDTSLINSPTQGEYFLGFGFFNDKKDRGQLTLPENHYIRWAFGWGTPSNISEIIRFKSEKDEYNNRLTSLFYGIPIAESLFAIPIDLYITSGFAYHLKSEVQDPIAEGILAIKAYYTFTWPSRWRFGFAEGLSYVSQLTYIEQTEIAKKGYENGSKILNYLDFSLDINLGDIFNSSQMDKLWLGYSIHHRSAIFEQSSLFGRIKGGSNYNTVYLQWHF